ncbi:ABC transporter substrate-binding protein [Paenibacillus sp. V4I7]|uniref:ABC transporter substrate-binding protein n=1 Tax=Paenibacillus sp. V4I7 TaxID=3042307 RepID=UPI00277FAC2F|nr:ABC transporter substrate-binding protein [Paenibacillus sp. V4I7]MDQ0900983.1 putative aldouronate transport system substrate-binding protein [Paenibacillus sp. V4I7]
MKKLLFSKVGRMMLASVFALSLLAGCSSDGGTKPVESPKASTDVKQEPAKLEPANLKMVLLGDKPKGTGLDTVLQELNKKIKTDLNATLTIEYLPWSDWTQKYSLLLSSGEPIDLMYTSLWAYYVQEATKGAFVEVTEDILKKYMPLTWATQDKVSFEQTKLNGKMYFVTKNTAAYTGEQAVVIRGDLREKHGIPPLQSIADLEKYFDAVVKNEKGIFPYAAATDNDGFRGLIQDQANKIIPATSAGDFSYTYTKTPKMEDMIYTWDSPAYVAFAKKMKDWANKGYWSRNALSNKTLPGTAFENGTSASHIHNIGTVNNSAAKVAKEHPEWKPEIYDLTPDSIKRLGLYTNDGMAVPASSKNKERAFMLLDKMKNDRSYFDLFQYGIQGKHWEPVGDKGWKSGPEGDQYIAGGAWGFGNKELKRTKEGAYPVEAEFEKKWNPVLVHPATETFVFDESNIKNEMAALTTVRTKYKAMLSLGMAEDVDKTISEFKDQAKKAGLDKIEAEFRKQMQAFLEKNNK